jgi:hypothetical protein
MDEIISYKMCAVKVRNAKLRNYLKRAFFYKTSTNVPRNQAINAIQTQIVRTLQVHTDASVVLRLGEPEKFVQV